MKKKPGPKRGWAKQRLESYLKEANRKKTVAERREFAAQCLLRDNIKLLELKKRGL